MPLNSTEICGSLIHQDPVLNWNILVLSKLALSFYDELFMLDVVLDFHIKDFNIFYACDRILYWLVVDTFFFSKFEFSC
jgi:hypothetical protein